MNDLGTSGSICAETVPSFRPVEIPAGRRRGFVYFATDGTFIKIGHSVSPTHRLVVLRSPAGNRLDLIAYFPGFMDEEHNLHRLFAEHLAHGAEWFRPHQAITDFIAKLEGHRGPLQKRRISINDVIFGRHIKILEMPDMTKTPHIPEGNAEFEKWADRECPNWPADLMAKAARASCARKGLYGSDPKHIEQFAEAYWQWAGA